MLTPNQFEFHSFVNLKLYYSRTTLVYLHLVMIQQSLLRFWIGTCKKLQFGLVNGKFYLTLEKAKIWFFLTNFLQILFLSCLITLKVKGFLSTNIWVFGSLVHYHGKNTHELFVRANAKLAVFPHFTKVWKKLPNSLLCFKKSLKKKSYLNSTFTLSLGLKVAMLGYFGNYPQDIWS